jgi:hypothetical protein
MAWYQFHDENKKSFLTSDSLVWIDERLSTENKVEIAKGKVKNLQGIKPHFNPSYIAKYHLRREYTNFIKL